MKYTNMLMAIVLCDQSYYFPLSFFPYSLICIYVTFIIEKIYLIIKDI